MDCYVPGTELMTVLTPVAHPLVQKQWSWKQKNHPNENQNTNRKKEYNFTESIRSTSRFIRTETFSSLLCIHSLEKCLLITGGWVTISWISPMTENLTLPRWWAENYKENKKAGVPKWEISELEEVSRLLSGSDRSLCWRWEAREWEQIDKHFSSQGAEWTFTGMWGVQWDHPSLRFPCMCHICLTNISSCIFLPLPSLLPHFPLQYFQKPLTCYRVS